MAAEGKNFRKQRTTSTIRILNDCMKIFLGLSVISFMSALFLCYSGCLDEPKEEKSSLKFLIDLIHSISPTSTFRGNDPDREDFCKNQKRWSIQIYTNLLLYINNIQDEVFPFVMNSYVMVGSVLLFVTYTLLIVLFVYLVRLLCCRPSKERSVEAYKKQVLYKSNQSNLWLSARQLPLITIILMTLISIPWEFVRLYQNEVSKKVAVTTLGLPPQCQPNDMSFWTAVRSWLLWQFSWSRDPCEKYYQALLVDPLWEVTPMLVLSSAFTRCIIKPVEIFCMGIGQALRALFAEIPTLWQPAVMAFLVFIFIMVMIMMCGYKVSIPFILHIEPRKSTRICSGSSSRAVQASGDLIGRRSHNQKNSSTTDCRARSQSKDLSSDSSFIDTSIDASF